MTFLSTLLLAATTVTNVPAYRGVVEGYYGRPWGTTGRISLMDFMGDRNLNTFVYGPKDDPYHHAKWREPYPKNEARDFQMLLKVAKANKINFYWAIHLGNFQDEYPALFNKLESMYNLGVRSFAVFFDDFGSANAELHSTIGNRVIKEFLEKKGDCSPLLICPNVYWGYGHPYQKELGEKLDKSAMIMWTGKTICSDIRAEDVSKITEDFQRPPFIWWNWPVNDYCRSRVLLGRLYGLDSCTYAGVVLNPMENCELNKISIHSFGEWCKDPEHFDSEKVWNEGFAKIFKNPEVAEAMRIFALHNSDQGPNGHGYRREESVDAKAICDAARQELHKYGDLSTETREKLYKVFRDLDNAAFTLVKHLGEENLEMLWELEGWILDEMHLVDAGMIVLDLLENRDHVHCRKAVDRLSKGRYFRKLSQKVHMKKFQQATFENDRKSIKPPRASESVLSPLVADLMKFTLAREYRIRTGKDFSEAFGLKSISGAKAFPNLSYYIEEGVTGLDRVFEQRKLDPDEFVGIQVPETVTVKSFDVRLSLVSAQQACTLEGSVDGQTWTEFPKVHREGERLYVVLDSHSPIHYLRVKNVSGQQIDMKLTMFRVELNGSILPADALIDALVEK